MTEVWTEQVRLRGGVTYTFRTDSLTGVGPDTVMHLVRDDGVWIASNDECSDPAAGAHGSCITVTPRFTARYRLLVHAYDRAGIAQGAVVMFDSLGGVRRFSDCTFGGLSFRTPEVQVGWTAGDEVVSVSPLTGPERAVCAMLAFPAGRTARNDVRLVTLDARSSWMGGCRLVLPGRGTDWEQRWLVAGSAPGADGGQITLYVNDVADDTDGDGLGNDLEAQVKTCSGEVGDGECAAPVVNGMDSDGDGLHDAWELLGRPPGLPLPRWGANPRHKDAFIEVDRRAAAPSLTASGAQTVASIYLAAPWRDVGNPDGRDGIDLHFDIGVSGCFWDDIGGHRRCVTTYGDWGGHSVVPDGSRWEEVVGDPANFSEERRGVFTYALAEVGAGGGQCCGDRAVRFGASAPGGATVDALGHEWGHLLGLAHGAGGGAQVNCKPNYPSMMNYAFGSSRRFSTGTLGSLNPIAMMEADGVGTDPAYMKDIWQIATGGPDGRALDWNRDGLAGVSGPAEYGYALWAPGVGCETTWYHRHVILEADAYPDKSPAVASYDDSIWVFWWTSIGDNLGYAKLRPISDLGGDLRRCGPEDDPWSPCVFQAPPRVVGERLTSSPFFVRCPACPRRDGLQADRLVGVYARGRDADARYVIQCVDRNEWGTPFELPGARPRTFANVAPYVDPRESAVADPALAVVRTPGGRLVFVLYRHTDGTLHQVVLDERLEIVRSDEQVIVGGAPVPTAVMIGRDPALLFDDGILYAYYVAPGGRIRRLRWIPPARVWVDQTDEVFAERLMSVNQPSVVSSGDGLPRAHRLQYRSLEPRAPLDPTPEWRLWTDANGRFSWTLPDGTTRSYRAYSINMWDADYRGATRLALFNGVEVAARIGSYGSPLDATSPDNANAALCVGCDCHLGTRPDASGGRTACGHPDGWGASDRNACACPNARSVVVHPLADGILNARLEDHNDWQLVREKMCGVLRGPGAAECRPPGAPAPIHLAPQPCVLLPQVALGQDPPTEEVP
ncbi:MAG: hypothetical protein GYA57_09125 [Myxococcales bacterium]|nr:hypothetical protein [Myxococcales bacterium]